MNMAEFRAAHPGLYQQAFDAGVEAERERADAHFEFADAAGGNDALARNAIQHGWTVLEALPRYEEQAAKSDKTSARFIAKRDLMLREAGRSVPGGAALSGEDATDRAVEHLLAIQRRPPSAAVASDFGDRVAEAYARNFPARQSRAATERTDSE